MSILSKQSIQQAIEEGKLGITPFDAANLKEASYTFTLDTRILEPISTGITHIDKKPQYKESVITKDGFLLKPNHFILGFTKEHIKLNGTFACFLSNRGSCAQAGLHVLLGSGFAEPDTDNPQTLEIINVGHDPILLHEGVPIVKGIFSTLE